MVSGAAFFAPDARAFDLDTYAEHSRLAEGRWVKVRVESTGMHILSNATLRSMGFSNPDRVRVFGYGGARISDLLTAASFNDDLPLAPQRITDAGIVFYGVGGDWWERSANTIYYHRETSPYTSSGYYFVGEIAEDAIDDELFVEMGLAGEGSYDAVKTAQARVQHEVDLSLATEAGPLLVGEDFRFTPTRTFSFTMPGRVEDSPVWMECQFVARHVGVTSQLTFTIGDWPVPAVSTDKIASTSDSHYVHASIDTTRHTFTPQGLASPEAMTITVSHSCEGVVSKANLDYIAVNYTRSLELPAEGSLEFWSNERALSLGGIGSDLQLWDVTVPTAAGTINYGLVDGRAVWRPAYTGMRSYVAWRPGATLPEPKVVGTVANQDLHGTDTEGVDMVIFAPTALIAQGERISRLHASTDGVRCHVVDVNEVYNEFGSGAPDVSALRRYLKMVYDRSLAAEKPLRYALLLGRTTLDNRCVDASLNVASHIILPAWVSRTARHSMNDNDGYTTDDYLAMLEDNSGNDHGLDNLSIAVGRMPVTGEADCSELIDKLEQYITSSKRTGWKNRIMVLADDEDQGVHLRQAEAMVKCFMATEGMQHIVDKIYIDAYTKMNGEYPDARRDMFRALEEGVAWWLFTGHANNHSWTGDGQLTYTDINNMYLRNLPFVIASTCDFLRWDSETESGGEIMYKERYGGAIGMISATRPVYITDNGYYLQSLGRALLARDENGNLFTPGEIYRRSKNDILNSKGEHASNTNRLRFVFMGDPAMPLTTPSNIVELLTIDGREVSLDGEVTLGALSCAELTGRITSPDGTLLTDFDGVVSIDIYDALRSITSNANGNGHEETFDRHGERLYSGSAQVKGGEFTLRIAMPEMIADNWRPATMSLYAAATNSNAEAIGVNREFYVYGLDESVSADDNAPVIEAMYINHEGFKGGDAVNSSPMVIARVRDDIGINLSTAGVGHQMAITVDGSNTYNDVASYYVPATDGTASGVINYPLSGLAEGAHSVRLRVFDTSGNLAEQTIDLWVNDAMAPQIFEVYSDANPASTQARFYVRHDRPENIVSVSVTVYDLLGHPVWTGSSKGMSDGDISAPVTWDLTDSVGRRVARGIYVYRATISTDSSSYETASQRIAVTAR